MLYYFYHPPFHIISHIFFKKKQIVKVKAENPPSFNMCFNISLTQAPLTYHRWFVRQFGDSQVVKKILCINKIQLGFPTQVKYCCMTIWGSLNFQRNTPAVLYRPSKNKFWNTQNSKDAFFEALFRKFRGYLSFQWVYPNFCSPSFSTSSGSAVFSVRLGFPNWHRPAGRTVRGMVVTIWPCSNLSVQDVILYIKENPGLSIQLPTEFWGFSEFFWASN